jgi:putative flavoprotein involved in K+ transport
MNNKLNAVVIGAGASGLAAGYFLRRSGLRFKILEAAAEPGGSWPHYYDSLRLFSPGRYSSLPGLPFPGEPEEYPSRDEVTEYLRLYARYFRLPVETGQRVERVERAGESFVIRTAPGEVFNADSVILAIGAFNEPYLPEFRGQNAFEGEILHSASYRGAERFRGKRVVVVGTGNSAIQIAIELTSVAEVSLATRGPIPFRPQRLLGKDVHFWARVLGLDFLPVSVVGTAGVLDTGSYREAVDLGRPDRRPLFDAFTRQGVIWADGVEEYVDIVLMATGFRPRFPFLSGLSAVGPDGDPLHRKGVSTTESGLYYLGLVGQRNFASATLRGAGADARYIINHLRRRASRFGSKERYCTWRHP